jgi:transcriptional regulator with XRE-family HTH domain
MVKRLMARVRELRKARGLTQEQFAERADIKYKHYQDMEAGRHVNFQFITVQKLANAFGLELYQLLNFDSPLAAVGDERSGTYETAADSKPAAKKSRKASSKPRSKRPKT